MKLMTARQVAELTGIPQGSIYRMSKAGLLPFFKVGVKRRGLRYRADEVVKALAQPAQQTGGGETPKDAA